MIYMIEQLRNQEESIVWEEGKQPIHVPQRALSFINTWCMCHGSTYVGRKQACSYHMQIKQKIPILISEQTKEILFPTCAIHNPECLWINYYTLCKAVKNKDKTILYFRNGEERCIACDIRVIKREMKLCAIYLQFIMSFS